MNGPLAHRAGPLFGLLLVVVGAAFAVTPVVPSATAADPTPGVSVDPGPGSPEPTPGASAEPPPAATPDPGSTPDPTAEPTPDVTAAPEPSATAPVASPEPSPGLHVTHAWIDDYDPMAERVLPGGIDADRAAVERFHVYEVRFQVLNDSDTTLEFTPSLRMAAAGGPAADLPTPDRIDAAAFYVSVRPGDTDRAQAKAIPPGDLRLAESADAGASAVAGWLVLARNPAPAVSLAPHTFTEIAFAVRATPDAAWLASYTFQLSTSAAAEAEGADVTATMRSKPRIVLSPNQRSGVRVEDSQPQFGLRVPATTSLRVATGQTGVQLAAVAAPPPVSPHFTLSLVADTCAACHDSHDAQGDPLLRASAPQSKLCFSCHDGSGAVANVKAEYVDPAVPANDPGTASWYSHPATTVSSHTSDRDDEFSGRLDRHAACADCHQPHLADASGSVQTAAGWTASGATKGASGVAVVNGAAGTSPSYTRSQGTALEYELCFKCHSGATELGARDPAHPSRWPLDKAVELNPANLSYHPVEAAGTNATTAMTASLAGTSPFKLWTFAVDSTIRCTNCHGDSRLATPASPPAADARSAPHAVANRGILMAPYRDRLLKPQGEGYAAADFALCYQCHAESPMADMSGEPNAATNFAYHGVHLNIAFPYGSGSQDIDTDGGGQGNLLCAECHFRIHGTTDAVDGQPPAQRLVNFAPVAQPYQGVLRFSKTATGGTCTLVCHGVSHRSWSY